jgi:hypothetical protein
MAVLRRGNRSGRREHVAAAGLAFQNDVVSIRNADTIKIDWVGRVRASESRLEAAAFTGLQKQMVPTCPTGRLISHPCPLSFTFCL